MRWTLRIIPVALAVATACYPDSAIVDDPTDCFDTVPDDVRATSAVLIAIEDFAFSPADVRVRPGDVVTWINCEAPNIDSHTSTADDQTWDSPFLTSGEYFTRQFPVAADFAYHCVPHPFMRGRILVEDGGEY
jgi:plastocyanin